MGVEPESRVAGNVVRDRGNPTVGNRSRATTRRADDVVVVGGCARHEGVLARRQVDALEGAESAEDVKGAEDRGPGQSKPASARRDEQALRGEVPSLTRNQVGQGAARLRDAEASRVHRLDQIS